MAPFDFGEASEEGRATLRGNPRQCMELLAACRELARRLGTTGCIDTPLSEQDEAVLQGFHRVLDAHTSHIGQYDGAFEQLCHLAGLRPSDRGLLSGRIRRLYQMREPVQYEAEVHALIRQWMLDSEKGRR
jgi:hypothetical protein